MTPTSPSPTRPPVSSTPATPPPPAPPAKRRRPLLLVLAALGIALLGWLLWSSTRDAPVVLQGQLEAQETDIAPKVAGRIAEVLVSEGQQVQAGTPLLRMDAPEIDAKLAQAQAAQIAAQAQADKATAGARPQEIEMARADWQRAQAAADLAQSSWQRVNRLANEGLLSMQKRDEARANHLAAGDQARAARARYDMAVAGARPEDRTAADAQAAQVGAVVAEAEVALAESRLHSPLAGQVAKVLAQRGEINPAGVPTVTLVDLDDQWLVLNVREDLLQHFAIGSRFNARVPALGAAGESVAFTVFASQVLPDFATWRSTRADQGFDVRSFEIKARPEQPLPGMRPGMSALVTL